MHDMHGSRGFAGSQRKTMTDGSIVPRLFEHGYMDPGNAQGRMRWLLIHQSTQFLFAKHAGDDIMYLERDNDRVGETQVA